jgi:UDP-N-acetylmuramate dehydrogenase
VNLSIAENVDLQPLNTLALPARARWFARIETTDQLAEALAWAQQRQLPRLVLGGGSNIVLRGDFPGLVLQIALAGRAVDGDVVSAAAGENWHSLVQWTLAQGLFGLENLTLIPGTVGAAPIQNIGAYGVELADRLVDVRGWSLDDAAERTLSAAECRFGYRDSLFKRELRDRFIITAIRLRLDRLFRPVLHYPALRDALAGVAAPDALAVEAAVRAIRQRRLPDPEQLPNAGSFFKNPVVSRAQFERLRADHPDLPQFPATGDGVKLPAAWLVDRCGWKGRRIGPVGVHAQQAIVLIHYLDGAGAHDGEALLQLAAAIQADVRQRFGVTLELEPTIYGGS